VKVPRGRMTRDAAREREETNLDRRAWRRGSRGAARLRPPAAIVCVLLFGRPSGVAATPPGRGPGPELLTPAEIADALEPWSLEPPSPSGSRLPPAVALPPRPGSQEPPGSEPGPGALPEPGGGPGPGPGADRGAGATAGGGGEPDGGEGGERVLVVRCRQLLVAHPEKAARLAAMLRGGASFEAARRALATDDLEERTREYAIDELDPGMRAEVEALPESAWSRPHPWRGRTLLYQVAEKKMRARSSIPQLGEGLDAVERERITNLAPATRGAGGAPPGGAQSVAELAAVVNQVQAEFPKNVRKAGEVTVVVTVGRLGEVIDVQVASSTDPVFEAPALEAARRSTYRPAKLSGRPARGEVTLTFRFAAPQ